MIRRFTCLFVLLAMLLSAGALAEQPAVYEPGQIALDLFRDAWRSGRIITGDIQLSISGDAEKLGLAGEEAAAFDAVAAALDQATLSVGAGRTEDGVRLELSAAYAADAPVAFDAALNITYDGLLAETSLLPGESVSIRWETLLALCELTDEEISQVLALRDMDLNAAMQAFAAEIGPMLEMASGYLAPYGETIVNFIAGLPMELQENVPGDDYYPAAAQEITIAVTAYDVGVLITRLADQLENDAVLNWFISTVLAQQEDVPLSSAAELCAAIRSAAAELTDTDYPVYLYIGLDGEGAPLYLSVAFESPNGSTALLSGVYAAAPESNASELRFDLCTLDAQDAIIDGFSFALSSITDPFNPHILSLTAAAALQADSEPVLSLEYGLISEAFTSPEGQSGYAGSQSLSMTVADGDEPLTLIMSADTQQAPTAGGGEHILATGAMDTYVGDVSVPITFANELIVTQRQDGPVAVYTEKGSMSEIGLDHFEETYTLYTKAYDPAATAALELTALETVTEDGMNGLLQRLTENADALAARLRAALPENAALLLFDTPAE